MPSFLADGIDTDALESATSSHVETKVEEKKIAHPKGYVPNSFLNNYLFDGA